MKPLSPGLPEADHLDYEAAHWVLRLDRGLSAVEQDEYTSWLAADPRHGAALARHKANWSRLNRLPQWLPEHSPQPNPDLLAPPASRQIIPWLLPLAAAAALALAAVVWWPRANTPITASEPISATAPVVAVREMRLDDGSVIVRNRGAVVIVTYTRAERRVRLEAGEAHFTVVKDSTRPFIVSTGGVDVRAVGTAFNVRLQQGTVEVLVTEGRVGVTTGNTAADATTAPPPTLAEPLHLDAGQRAVVPLTTTDHPIKVATLTGGEIERLLDWQPRLLDFTATPLSTIVSEFNRRNAVRLVLADGGMDAVRISATFRSDNVEGFVNLLEAGFGIRAERAGDTITLRRAP